MVTPEEAREPMAIHGLNKDYGKSTEATKGRIHGSTPDTSGTRQAPAICFGNESPGIYLHTIADETFSPGNAFS
jgi:hypothetical protein